MLLADVNNINWQPASNALLNKNPAVLPHLKYQLCRYGRTVGNCPITETTEVLVKTAHKLFFYTKQLHPQRDGLNDRFRAMPIRPVQYFQLAVYNRYGQNFLKQTDFARAGMAPSKQTTALRRLYLHCRYRFAGSNRTERANIFVNKDSKSGFVQSPFSLTFCKPLNHAVT